MSVGQNEVVRVTLLADFGGVDDVQNVFQFSKASTGTITNSAALDELIEALEAIVEIIKLLANAYTIWRGIRVENLTAGTLVGERSFAAPIPGTVAGESNAAQITAPVSFKTDVPRVILRKDVGPVAEGILSNGGAINQDGQDALDDLITFLLANITTTNETWVYGYLSTKAGGFIAPLEGTYTSVPGTQRRRRVGRGS